jgi:hypothetical protein
VCYDPATYKAMLRPNRDLKRGATYRAVVTTEARDLDGTALALGKTWTFIVRR